MRHPTPPEDDPALAAIRRTLTDAEFPTTKKRLLDEAGNWEVTFPDNRDIRLAEIVERVPRYKFHDPDEVVDELRRGWWFLSPDADPREIDRI